MATTSKIPQAGPVALDGTDRAILAALMEDGRMTNAALATRVGVAESTCAYRVKALRESGVIASINARVDLAAVASPERLRDLILEHVTSHPAVTKTETQLVFEVREGRGVLGPL